MFQLDSHPSGRHFLQIPGPTNVPDRVLRAIDQPTIDHRGPEFARLALDDPRRAEDESSRPTGPVVIYPASGTGAWEAALVNTLSPGDRVLMFETGHFATLWRALAEKLGLAVDFVPGDWRSGVDPAIVEAQARRRSRARDQGGAASCTTRRRPASRAASPTSARRSTAPAIRRCSWSTRSRRWPRSTIATTNGASTSPSPGSQKGLMLPPGLSFNADQRQGARREQAGEAAALLLGLGRDARDEPAGLLPVHAGDQPALRPARGARDAARRGADHVFARHERHAEATRRAVARLGARDPVRAIPPNTAAR